MDILILNCLSFLTAAIKIFHHKNSNIEISDTYFAGFVAAAFLFFIFYMSRIRYFKDLKNRKFFLYVDLIFFYLGLLLTSKILARIDLVKISYLSHAYIFNFVVLRIIYSISGSEKSPFKNFTYIFAMSLLSVNLINNYVVIKNYPAFLVSWFLYIASLGILILLKRDIKFVTWLYCASLCLCQLTYFVATK